MRDDIDLGAAVFYGPLNPATCAATVPLTGVEFQPGKSGGLRPIFQRPEMNARWPDVLVWPPKGYIQWTLCAGFQVGGQWHIGAMHEFWSDRNGPPREWTGAHPLELTDDGSRNNWQGNWAYARDRWGALAGYTPKVGDPMALVLVAGAVRPGSSNHPTVAERSNVLVVPLQLTGMALQAVPTEPATEPAPSAPPPLPAEPATEPANPPQGIPPADLDTVVSALDRQTAAIEAHTAMLKDCFERIIKAWS